MTLLKVENVWTAYGSIVVNRGVSLEVDEGEIVTLIGPNGAGKSTLLKTIAGLKRPKSGSLRLAGKDVTGVYADRMARDGVVLVPEGRRIFPAISVRDNLRLGGYARYDPEGVERDIARMESFFPILAEKREAKGGDLSGGQQQMLALSRAYMRPWKVILLDEVSLGLAPVVIDEIFAFLSMLKSQGTSLLLVEQYVARALAIADHAYVVTKGTVVYDGPAASLEREEVFERYVGQG